MNGSSKRPSICVLAIGLLGWGVLIWLSLAQWRAGVSISLLWSGGFFLALSTLVGLQPVRLPGRGGAITTVGFAVDYACLLIFGPAVAAWIGIISFLVLLRRSPWIRQVFNQGQLALSFAGAGFAYHALGGHYVISNRPVPFTKIGLALLAAAAVYCAISSLLISIAMALYQRRSVLGLWGVSFRWVAPRLLALAPFGLLMAMVFQTEGLGIFAVALFLVPLVGARFVFKGTMEMLDVHRQTVWALSNALEAFDPWTRNHSELVTRYALHIGRELGLTESRLEALEWAGRLHDIGKCRQDWEPIIRKPGRPSDQEWEVIKQHPIEGGRLAESMEFLPHTAGMVATMVRSHHERVDGSGYPNGETGDQLSLEVKILGVADAFEAMTARRAYHRQRPPQDAIEELRRCAGTQFDTQVVETLATLWERGEIRMEEPAGYPLLVTGAKEPQL